MRKLIQKIGQKILFKIYPQLENLIDTNYNWGIIQSAQSKVLCEEHVKLYGPYHISNSKIGKYTYIAQNSYITATEIGRFCSIGPNLISGWGIHPTNGISTHPMFYSVRKQNGISLSTINKIEEIPPIFIGNDVFIGANVTILNGVTIGDGAVIGAGAVVSKDIPPYAIAVGCPIQIKKNRFNNKIIEQMKQIEWWNFPDDKLKEVEQFFFDIDKFIERNLK